MSTSTINISEIENGSVISAKGFKVDGVHTKVKRSRNDLGVIYSEKLAKAAAVYTLNQIKAAPLDVTKEAIQRENKIQAVIINSGNANACTGQRGMEDAYAMQAKTAKQFGLAAHHVAVASTGIIGLNMPMDKILPGIEQLNVAASDSAAAAFSQSILTTDKFTKNVAYQTEISGQTVTMGGVAKGSGMIEPNMGTMLSFITTDATIEADMLQLALKETVNETFNAITVDGDTSTNDMVLVLANEMVDHTSLTPAHPDWEKFVLLLKTVCEDLAKKIARDGEGATKLIEVAVSGAASDQAARKIAKSIVGSSLVKTAVYGTDANWGRVIAAVGYSGETVNPKTIDMAFGPIALLRNSEPLEFSEEEATAYLENENIEIHVNLNQGTGQGKAWGCDLTYDYVRINASYRS